MGELIVLADWKEKKDLEEIDQLREELRARVEELGEPEPVPYVPEPEPLHRRMMSCLFYGFIDNISWDGYRHWPVDSSDM